MKRFSTIASPLHALTSAKNHFVWSKQAEVFQLLKKKFTTAPILTLPDPKHQFVVEVDASDVEV